MSGFYEVFWQQHASLCLHCACPDSWQDLFSWVMEWECEIALAHSNFKRISLGLCKDQFLSRGIIIQVATHTATFIKCLISIFSGNHRCHAKVSFPLSAQTYMCAPSLHLLCTSVTEHSPCRTTNTRMKQLKSKTHFLWTVCLLSHLNWLLPTRIPIQNNVCISVEKGDKVCENPLRLRKNQRQISGCTSQGICPHHALVWLGPSWGLGFSRQVNN